MTSLEQLLAAYDESMLHEWESIRSALQNVTEDMAQWQPPGYAGVVDDDYQTQPGTIFWQAAHLEHCLRHYAAVLDARPLVSEPDTPPPAASTLAEITTALTAAFNALRTIIASLTQNQLEEICSRSMTVEQFIRMITRHNTWHAGQMALVKRVMK